jgi:small subunit ribosomal protein S11
MKIKSQRRRIRSQRVVEFGFIKIKQSFNNIFITLTDVKGNVISSKHAGLLKFKGSKKKTPFVAGLVLKDLISSIKKLNVKVNCFIVQIYGYVRSSSTNIIIKQLRKLRIRNVIYLGYINKRVHNGLRAKKKRRL